MDWATFWAIFSKTHLVALVGTDDKVHSNSIQSFFPTDFFAAWLRCRFRKKIYDEAQKLGDQIGRILVF
jgi:hypothetical protein